MLNWDAFYLYFAQDLEDMANTWRGYTAWTACKYGSSVHFFLFNEKMNPVLSKRGQGFSPCVHSLLLLLQRKSAANNVGTDIKSWTLRSSFSHISTWTTSLWLFPVLRCKQNRKAGLGLHSLFCTQTSYQQCSRLFCPQWLLRLPRKSLSPLQQWLLI